MGNLETTCPACGSHALAGCGSYLGMDEIECQDCSQVWSVPSSAMRARAAAKALAWIVLCPGIRPDWDAPYWLDIEDAYNENDFLLVTEQEYLRLTVA